MPWESINHTLGEMHSVVVNLAVLVLSVLFLSDVLWRKWSDIKKRNGKRRRK